MIRALLVFVVALAFLVSIAQAACTGSSPTWNCPANATDIGNLISGTGIGPAVAGDTINVASGTIASLSVTVNGIKLIGAGSSTALMSISSSSGTIIQAGTITVTKHSSQNSQVSGFSFTGSDNHLNIGGSSSNKPFIIDHNYLYSNGGDAANRMVILAVNGGLFHTNYFFQDPAFCAPNCNADVFNIQTGETWTDGDQTIGTGDSTGERNIYFENNRFFDLTETGPDCDQRSRVVFRYNLYEDSSITCHSGWETSAGYSDSTSGGGVRHFEVYSNVFKRISNSIALNKWFWVRGATGVIANNAMDVASSPDGSTYPSKPEIRLSTNCNGQSWPIEHQVGQINKVPDSTPDLPLLIFGNTAGPNSNGPADADFVDINASNSAGFTCSNPTNYIQVNRDYYLSNQWSWAPYATCPHQLSGYTGSCNSTAGPSGYNVSNIGTKKIQPRKFRRN